MARPPRLLIPGYPQHVMIRGVDGQATFFADHDYARFKETVVGAAPDCEFAVHAYVLMTNHVHFLVTPANPDSIPRMIQSIGRNYVQAINRKYDRKGTLWQSRYKACLVQDDNYLLHCQRYIELNPVRAHMVSQPGDYPHSSYRTNAYGRYDPLVTPHPTYLDLAPKDEQRQRIYRRMFSPRAEPTVVDRIRDATRTGQVLGSRSFRQQINAMSGGSDPRAVSEGLTPKTRLRV